MKTLRPGVCFALVCPALSPRSQTYCIEQGIDFIGWKYLGQCSWHLHAATGRTARRRAEQPSLFPDLDQRLFRTIIPSAARTAREAKTLDAHRNRQRTQSRDRPDRPGVNHKADPLCHQSWLSQKLSPVSTSNSGCGGKAHPWSFPSRAACCLCGFFCFRNKMTASSANSTNAQRPKESHAFASCTCMMRAFSCMQGTKRPCPKVSNIQAYLDLYARGGRDFKQADYLLEKAIAPRWKAV